MLTVITSKKTNENELNAEAAAQTQNVSTDKMSGEELLLSYMLWEQKFEGDAHDHLADPVDVFLTSQGEKKLELA